MGDRLNDVLAQVELGPDIAAIAQIEDAVGGGAQVATCASALRSLIENQSPGKLTKLRTNGIV